MENRRHTSVWDAIEETPEAAANMRLRSSLLMQISAIVERNGWTQAEAARRCRLTQPRVSALMRGKIEDFSLDALVNIAAALGQTIRIELAAGDVEAA